MYMKDVYAKYCSKKRIDYGVHQYYRDLIKEICSYQNPCRILEVAIGDGFPYSSSLDDLGYDVYGIDISPIHVNMVSESLPNVKVVECDAENLTFKDGFFDVVFCFRSTWYFPDIIKSISEMIRVTRRNGLIIFDIQNINNSVHQKMVKRNIGLSKNHPITNIIKKYVKNILKLILRPFVYYGVEWSFYQTSFIETPTDPEEVINFLKKRKDIKYVIYGVKWNEDSTLYDVTKSKNLNKFDRLVFKGLIV